MLFASSVGDPEGTRTITAIVLLLGVLGIALVMLAFWLFRLTRPDKELLAPLEVMGERKWRRADPVWQRRRLDEVRPDEAQPLQPSAAPPDFDEGFFERAPAAGGFDDLHDDSNSKAGSSAQGVDEVPIEGAGAEPELVVAEVAGPEQNGEPAPNAEQAPSPAPVIKPMSPTPIGIDRPMELPDGDLDPDLMAAALAELDAELQLGREQRTQATD
jgi:hypothetical protein